MTNFEYCANEIIQFVEGIRHDQQNVTTKRFNGAAVSTIDMQMYKKMAHSLLSILKERYSETASIRILELGCGTGM